MSTSNDQIIVLHASRNTIRQQCPRCKRPIATQTGAHTHLSGNQISLTRRKGQLVVVGICATRGCRTPFVLAELPMVTADSADSPGAAAL
jgi:hypothetical protein